MILTLKKKGKILETVEFWRDRATLEIGRVTVFVGANGSGKTATLEAIAAHCGVFAKESDRDEYRNTAEVIRAVGDIAPDVEFETVLRHIGSSVHAMPTAVFAAEDMFRLNMHHKSHGEAGLFTMVHDVLDPLKKATGEILLLLDEPETGLSAEAQTLAALKFADIARRNDRVTMIAVTQSDRVRAELLRGGLGTEVDFGGWQKGNPWREEARES